MTISFQTQLSAAKWTFTTRRVPHDAATQMDTEFLRARPGDLILAHVAEIGQHRRVQLCSGRVSDIYPGDAVVLACGARYAPDQFEGVAEISPEGADLLAGGGCIGKVLRRNERIKPLTRLIPAGRLLQDDGSTVNLDKYSLIASERAGRIPVIAIFGTAMNSGKTVATAQLALGLRRAGWRVAALKGTGTGAFGDYNEYRDTGAHVVADFTNAGMVSTYLEPIERIRAEIDRLLAHAADSGCEIAVLEIADGLYQRETAQLLSDQEFQSRISGLVFACGDAVAATGGVAVLRQHGIEPDALTGMLSCSPMATAEATTMTGIPVLGKRDLSDPAEATAFALRAGAEWRSAA